MPALVLTIDTGTTNTRVRVWRDDHVIAQGDAAVGVRDTARTGSQDALRAGVRDAIAAALSGANAQRGDARLALASGMITSGLGLLELPHLPAPAGVTELAAGMREAHIPEVFDQPVWFVPGVRNDALPVTPDDAGAMDMMRGEEAEVIGLLDRISGVPKDSNASGAILLPGSHAKFVQVDEHGRITSCLSTLSGELFDLLARQSVLAAGMPPVWPDEVDEAALLAGAALSGSAGIGRSAFSTRVLEVYGNTTASARYGFLLGAVLMQDLVAWRASTTSANATSLVICGRPTVQHAYDTLARRHFPTIHIHTPAATTLADLAGHGVRVIARARGLL